MLWNRRGQRIHPKRGTLLRMPSSAARSVNSLISKLHAQRVHHVAAIAEIDAVFARLRSSLGAAGNAASTRVSRTTGGSLRTVPWRRVQGVKAALLASLSSKPQSPASLAARVSRRLGAEVSVAVQLQALKAAKKAKNPERGLWIKA